MLQKPCFVEPNYFSKLFDWSAAAGIDLFSTLVQLEISNPNEAEGNIIKGDLKTVEKLQSQNSRISVLKTVKYSFFEKY